MGTDLEDLVSRAVPLGDPLPPRPRDEELPSEIRKLREAASAGKVE